MWCGNRSLGDPILAVVGKDFKNISILMVNAGGCINLLQGRVAWKYYYHSVDHRAKTVEFLLTTKRDAAAAGAFLTKRCGKVKSAVR